MTLGLGFLSSEDAKEEEEKEETKEGEKEGEEGVITQETIDNAVLEVIIFKSVAFLKLLEKSQQEQTTRSCCRSYLLAIYFCRIFDASFHLDCLLLLITITKKKKTMQSKKYSTIYRSIPVRVS